MARACAVGCLGLAVIFSRNAHAGGADAGIALPPIVVPLPPAEAPAEAPARRDPTGALTTVEASAHTGEAKDAAELLAAAPSVVIQDQGGLGQLKTVSLRGASPNGVLFFLDGVPLNGAGGEVDLSSIPVAVIDRLEVLRGAAGSKYGSGGLGGAINIVTRPTQGAARVTGEVSYGSFGTEAAQAAGTGSLLGGEGLVLAHVAHSSGDFTYAYNPTPQLLSAPWVSALRQNNDATVSGGLLKWRGAVGDASLVDAMLEATENDRGLAGTVQNPTADAREKDQRLTASVHAAHTLQRGELSARAWLRGDDIHLSGGTFADGLQQREWAGGAEGQASYLWGIHGLALTVSGGREALAVAGGASPARNLLSAMAADEILLRGGSVSVVPSFRVDQVGMAAGISPKLGASAQLPAGLSVKANVGQAFRVPSFLELYVAQGTLLPNPLLKPERALFADGQLTHATAISTVSVGAFYALYEDLIAYEYYPPLFAKPYNFNAARVDGLEAEAQLSPRPWAGASAGYTLTFSQNLRDDPRYYLKELPYRPRHHLYGRTTGGPKWARGRLEVVYQSQEFTNRTQAVALPSRAFFNAGLSSELWHAPAVVASLELKNAFDTQAQDFDGYPLPGRAIYVTVSVSWDRAPEALTQLSHESPKAITAR